MEEIVAYCRLYIILLLGYIVIVGQVKPLSKAPQIHQIHQSVGTITSLQGITRELTGCKNPTAILVILGIIIPAAST